MRLAICALLSLSLIGSTASAGELETLIDWMTGSFSSEAQAGADEDYLDIRLELVPIWIERKDGRWLYVEQAAASALDKPYRQRVYHVQALEEGRFVSEVYEIPEPLRFAGFWATPEKLNRLTREELVHREGCSMILERKSDELFAGSTHESDCKSTHRGATYATSEVRITPSRVESWDRGYSDSGEQVWGARKGAYVFERKGD